MKRYIFFLLLLIILPFRLYKIDQPLVNITNFRQAQTATIALNYYQHGINLFQSELDIFGKGKEKYLTLEFPLYEAIVALLYKLFSSSDMWGRVVSLIAGIIGGWYLYKLVFLIFKDRILSFLSCFFYFFAPLNMYHQKDFLIEATVVSFLIAAAFYFCDWVKNSSSKSYFLAMILLIIGFIQKGMYGPFWLLPLSFYFLQKKQPDKSLMVRLILLVFIPLTALFLWQNHMNQVNIASGHEYFTTINRGHLEWNFGTIADRLSVSLWLFRLQNIINGIFLKPGILLFLIGLFAAKKLKNYRFLYFWFISEIIYFLLFFKIQSHIYYQMVMIPVISIFMASGLMKIGDMIDKLSIKYLKQFFIAIFLSFFIWKSWLNSQWDISFDRQWYNRLLQVGRSVPANSYGILINPGLDWNSVYTYYPKLKMMTVSVENVTAEAIKKWKNDGYSYLVLHEYDKYPDYLMEIKSTNSLDFLNKLRPILTLEDFKVYLI